MISRECWLTGVNLGKIDNLSDYLVAKGFEPRYNKCKSSINSDFNPNTWEKENMHISVYNKDYPIFISLDINEKDFKSSKNLIKNILGITGAKDIVDVVGSSMALYFSDNSLNPGK